MAIPSASYRSGTETVPADVFLPDGLAGPVPGVLVIHGSSGLAAHYKADMISFTEALSKNGIGAVLPHYFVAAKLRADTDGLPLIGQHYETWKTACKDALDFIAADARFDRSRLGVLGFLRTSGARFHRRGADEIASGDGRILRKDPLTP